MLLSEKRCVIDALKIILEHFEYLEYDEQRSQGQDYLHVEVSDQTAHRNDDVIYQIHKGLEQATEKRFMLPAIVGGERNWTYFRIRELSEGHSV